MTGDEAGAVGTEGLLGRDGDRGLGAAAIGDEAVGGRGAGDRLECLPHRADRTGDEDELGIAHALGEVIGRRIGDRRHERIAHRPVGIDPGDPAARQGAAQCERDRRPDQARSDDGDPLDGAGDLRRCAGHQRPTSGRSAARKRSFSAGRPTLTRNHSGKP